jgi:beta-glucosidase
VTFPKTVGQLPFNFPFKPASHASQSKEPDPNGFGNSLAEGALYPFGFGLSYTNFEYGALQISPAKIDPSGTVKVSCTVKNTGDREGDEVVQLYFHQETSSVTTYELNLCGFERIHLKSGETKTVTMELPASELQIISRNGKRIVEPGSFKVMLGSGSEDLRLTGSFEVFNASN